MDNTKKISFGFSKITKKPNLLLSKKPTANENAKELIKCLEGQEIKLVVEKAEAGPLVIAMKENQKTSTALASLIKRRAVLLGEEEPIVNVESNSEKQTPIINTISGVQTASLEERAIRELLATAQTNNQDTETSTLVLPVVKPDDLPLDGAKESNIDDYDNVPVQQFGLAMLRGMGWIEPPKQKNAGAQVEETNFVRPKGMGLGADKALKPKPLLVQPDKNEVLEIKKLAYVRILGGKHKDLYGQIEGFDDHAGRVIVKMAIGGAKEAFNEFLCQPVSKQEYAQYGKCINTAKYEEYKKMENEYGQIIIKKEEKERTQEHKIKSEKSERSDNKRYDEKYKDYKEHKIKDEQKYDERGRERERNEQKYYYDERKIKQENVNKRYDMDAAHRNKSNVDKYARASGSSSNSSSNNNTNRYRTENERTKDFRSSDNSCVQKEKHATSDDDDSDDSSDDTDSEAERKYKKKSTKNKSKKSKHKKQKQKSADASSDDESSTAHKRQRKKKTKSSRKRSRSRSRNRRR